MSTRINKLLNVRIIGTVIFLFSSQWSVAQVSDRTSNSKFRYLVVLGVARSTFEVRDVPSSPKYPSLELRLGVGLVKPLGKFCELKSGLYFGVKVKRESYYFGPTKNFTYEPSVIPRLDEAASNRNHFVLDIPLILQFNISHNKVGIRTGLNARLWKPHNDDVDVLAALHEIGILSGITHRITQRINIGLDLYLGLSNIYHGGIISNSGYPVSLKVTNQFAQLTVEYSL